MTTGAARSAADSLPVCEVRTNSFGSPYWAFLADREFVTRLAASDLQRAFRRVTLDPMRGLIVLMSPARAHERASELAGDVIKGIASLLGIAEVSLRSMRWRRPSDPPHTGPEPDCCFYVGDHANAYLAAEAQGEDNAEQFVLDNPPDIVVEIGVTHLDETKIDAYRDRRVSEYWEVERQQADATPSVRIVSLAASPAPTPMIASSLLPGVTPALFEDALRAATREVDSQAVLVAVRQTMEEHGAIAPKRGRPDDGTQGGGFGLS